MPAKSAGSEDKRSVLGGGSVLQQNVTKLAANATRSIAVQTEDPARRGISLWDRDPGRTPSAQFPTAMVEHIQERIHNIAQDMHIPNRTWREELVRSSLVRAPRSAPEKKRRRGVRPVKLACSDTVEETISSTDEAVGQRKRTRFYKGSSPCIITYTFIDTALHLHITTFHSHNSSFHRMMYHERATIHCSVTHSLQLKTDDNHARALLNNLGHGGYDGICVGEAENPGPATHARDWAVTEQPSATHRRIDEAGDQAPSSQDSVTRGIQNLCTSDSLVAPAALPAPPPPTMRNARRPHLPKQKPKEYLRCALCGPAVDAHLASTDGGLMQHMGQKHGGQVLIADSVGQLRWLSRQACVFCGAIR